MTARIDISESAARRRFEAAQDRVLDRYEVPAESRFVTTPTIEGAAHVLVSGEGPPVVMMIGGGMVAALWAPLMSRLHGFQLFAVDPPGHGLSSPAGYRTETMRAMAVDFLSQVLDGLGLEDPPLIAQSMGGLWASWLAIERPERVSGISYISCPAVVLGTSAPLPLRLSTIRRVRSLLEALDPPSPRQVQRMARMSGEDLTDLPELRDLFLAFELLPGTSRTLLGVHRSLVRLRGPRPEVELTAKQLAQIEQPAQLIWGETDPYGSPEIGEAAARILPRAQLHVVPGGHGPWFRQSETMAPIIGEFLARCHGLSSGRGTGPVH